MPREPLPDQSILPNRRPLASRKAGDEVFVRDPSSGQIHFLSPSAALIWECCDGVSSVAACAEKIRGHFSVPDGEDVEADVVATVKTFAERGLFEGV